MVTMKEHPILFSAPMVRAILEGRKTQTRRIVCRSIVDHPEAWSAFTVDSTERKNRDTWSISKPDPNGNAYGTPPETSSGRSTELWRGKCPFGAPGDRLWVRETWLALDADWRVVGRPSDIRGSPWPNVVYQADSPSPANPVTWRPSIHMPRWASRITLEVTSVRVERLQSISEADAKTEGVTPFPLDPEGDCWTDGTHRTAFEYLWQQINGKRASWESNPWAWVVEFKPC